ncbi:MAG: oligosaccharide flippase family protein [Euryarchaeota archaeon]|nr:oligosaccharide flippase family protein [Euryarchaeota archaeon]
MPGIKRKLVRNTIANAIMKFWGYIIGFLMFPFIVGYVGVEDYGLYLLVGAFVGYFGLLDFGVSGALVKYVAEYNAKNEKETINKVINSTFVFYTIIGVVICAFVLLLGTYYVDFFKIESGDLWKARLIAYLMAIGALTSWPMRSFSTSLDGLQRYDLSAIINFITVNINAIVTVTLLLRGFGIVEIIFSGIVIGALSQIIIVLIMKKLLPYVELKKSYIEFSTLKKVFTFSSVLFISQLIGILMFGFDRLLLGIFVSVAAITYYAVARKLFDIVATVTYIPQSALLPAATELEALNKKESSTKLLIKTSKYYSAVCLSTTVLIFFLAEPIILFWMGSEFIGMAIMTQVFISYGFFTSFGGVANSFLLVKEKYKVILLILLIISIANLILSIILVQYIGIMGVVLGTTIPNIVTAPILIPYMLKQLDIDIKRYLKSIVPQTYIPALIMSVSIYLIMNFITISSIVILGSVAIISLLIYYLIFYFIGLDKEEKNDLFRLITFKKNVV